MFCWSLSPPAAEYALAIVLPAYFPVLAYGILGKGGLFAEPIHRRLPYWANGLFYPSWNRLFGSSAVTAGH